MKSREMLALSSVIAVCRGISRYSSRRSTQTTRSTSGMISTSPGPLAPMLRPSRNTTTRWYSRTILTAARTTSTNRTRPMAIAIHSARFSMSRSFRLPGQRRPRLDDQLEALAPDHPHRRPGRDGAPGRLGAPALVGHPYLAPRLQRAQRDPAGAHQRVHARRGRQPAGIDDRADYQQEEPGE